MARTAIVTVCTRAPQRRGDDKRAPHHEARCAVARAPLPHALSCRLRQVGRWRRRPAQDTAGSCSGASRAPARVLPQLKQRRADPSCCRYSGPQSASPTEPSLGGGGGKVKDEGMRAAAPLRPAGCASRVAFPLAAVHSPAALVHVELDPRTPLSPYKLDEVIFPIFPKLGHQHQQASGISRAMRLLEGGLKLRHRRCGGHSIASIFYFKQTLEDRGLPAGSSA